MLVLDFYIYIDTGDKNYEISKVSKIWYHKDLFKAKITILWYCLGHKLNNLYIFSCIYVYFYL